MDALFAALLGTATLVIIGVVWLTGVLWCKLRAIRGTVAPRSRETMDRRVRETLLSEGFTEEEVRQAQSDIDD